MGLQSPTPTPSTARPGTRIPQLAPASTRAISRPPTPMIASPIPSTTRGDLSDSSRPVAAATKKLNTDSGMNTRPACSGDSPRIDCSHSDRYRVPANADRLSSSEPIMMPLNRLVRNSRRSSIGASRRSSRRTQAASTTMPAAIGPQDPMSDHPLAADSTSP